MTEHAKLIVALDVPTFAEMKDIVAALGAEVTAYKVGQQLFTAVGPQAITFLKERGKMVFLDAKLHEIPNSVASAVKAAGQQGVDMITVHASGGRKMMQAGVVAAAEFPGLKIIALTVVTGLSEADLAEIGFSAGVTELVVRLAKLAQASGCHGVVTSPQEISLLRREIGNELLIVTSGVRPAGSAPGDQNRVGTPLQAVQAGASYLVVGRPIVQAKEPAAAARQILAEMQRAVA